jgi:hypothetical protein
VTWKNATLSFDIRTGDRKWEFVAESEEELKKWIDAFSKYFTSPIASNDVDAIGRIVKDVSG